MNNTIWKFEKVAFIISFLVSLYLIVVGEHFNGMISILLLIILFGGNYKGKQSRSFVQWLVGIYTWFVGPLSIIIASLSPSIIRMVTTHSITDYISSKEVILSYSVKLAEFYIVFLIVISILERMPKKKKVYFVFHKIINTKYLFPLVILFAAIELGIRIAFSINVPGKLPTIPLAGVILYLFQGFNMFFLFASLYDNVSCKDEIKLRNIIVILIVAIITQIPNIVIGKRGGFLNAMIMIIIYIGFDKFSIELDRSIRNRLVRTIAMIIVISIVGIGVTNIFRTGKFQTIGFVFNRLTGLLDGTIALSGVGQNPPYRFSDYLRTVLFDSELTTNKYYTINILEYSVNAVHSNAMPIFIGEWFYGGSVGIVIITILETFFLTKFENNIKTNIKLQNEYCRSIEKSSSLFCSLYAIILLSTLHFLDGNITIWKSFLPIIICYLLTLITKDRILRK